MTPVLFFLLIYPSVGELQQGVVPGRGISLVWQSRLRSLGEGQEKDKKAWVLGLPEELQSRCILGATHPQQSALHPGLTLDGFAEPLQSATDQWEQEECPWTGSVLSGRNGAVRLDSYGASRLILLIGWG